MFTPTQLMRQIAVDDAMQKIGQVFRIFSLPRATQMFACAQPSYRLQLTSFDSKQSHNFEEKRFRLNIEQLQRFHTKQPSGDKSPYEAWLTFIYDELLSKGTINAAEAEDINNIARATKISWEPCRNSWGGYSSLFYPRMNVDLPLFLEYRGISTVASFHDIIIRCNEVTPVSLLHLSGQGVKTEGQTTCCLLKVNRNTKIFEQATLNAWHNILPPTAFTPLPSSQDTVTMLDALGDQIPFDEEDESESGSDETASLSPRSTPSPLTGSSFFNPYCHAETDRKRKRFPSRSSGTETDPSPNKVRKVGDHDFRGSRLKGNGQSL